MYPYLWVQETSNGNLEYGTYGLMLVTAFLLAALVTSSRFKKIGVNPDVVVPLLVVAIVSSILGARLLHFLGSPDDRAVFLANPLVLFNLGKGGMAVLGGIIGGVIGGAIFMKWKGVNVLKAADIAAPAIALGAAIGRFGCFFAGCCHGRACDLPVTRSLTGSLFTGGEIVAVDGFPFVAFMYHSHPTEPLASFCTQGVGMASIHDMPVFPTQLWEIITWTTVFFVLSWFWKHWRKFDGQIMAMFMFAYPVLRGTIELFRGDAVRGTGYLGGLSTSQVAAIPVLVLGLVLVLWRVRKGVAPEQEFQRQDDDLAYDEDEVD